ncbi:hypothetical protein [Fluviicola taffensis]|uniref:hypothetical protein n=1 Tax=Fluviicola taffensis TaxID=191579 RepID=UPI003137B4D4
MKNKRTIYFFCYSYHLNLTGFVWCDKKTVNDSNKAIIKVTTQQIGWAETEEHFMCSGTLEAMNVGSLNIFSYN